MHVAFRIIHIHATRTLLVAADCLLMAICGLAFANTAKADILEPVQSSVTQTMRTLGVTGISDAVVPAPDSRVLVDAWMYPDEPRAMDALRQIGRVQAVKTEYLKIDDSGEITAIEQGEDAPNGYSPENVAFLRQHSAEQYITISGWYEGTAEAMRNPATIPAIMDMVDKTGFNVELDWEGFGQWTPEYYAEFKRFVRQLDGQLAAHGKRLILDGPPINDETSQAWYQWKYEELAPLVDGVVMMVYDNQYDTGVGNAIAPTDWSEQCLRWLKDKAGDKAIAGIAAYGYQGNTDTGRMAVLPSENILRKLRLLQAHATRTASGELVVSDGDTFYAYADAHTLNKRYDQVADMGIDRLSVWSLGSNPWFTR